MHRVHLVVVILHPLQKDGLRDRVDVASLHSRVNCGFVGGHAWKSLERLGSDAVQVVDLEHLVKQGRPGIHGKVWEDTVNSLRFHVFFPGIKLQELAVVSDAQEIFGSHCVQVSSIYLKEVYQLFILVEKDLQGVFGIGILTLP